MCMDGKTMAKAQEKSTRAPQQKRSIDKKKRILEAAFETFCRQGYYKTTTTQVAKGAGVSIGCLYSYFTDKYSLFTAIMERYDSEFDAARTRALETVDGKPRAHAQTIRAVMTSLLEAHEASRELNREIAILAFSDPAIAARKEQQAEKILDAIRGYLAEHRRDMRPVDLEAAAIVVWKTISGLVDSMVFEPPAVGRERLIDATVDALCAYLVR